MIAETIRPTENGKWTRMITREPFFGELALGNMNQYRIGSFKIEGGLFIGIQGRGAYWFSGYAHHHYVSQKLGLNNESDARNVADFINYQIDQKLRQQGKYILECFGTNTEES